MSKFSNLIDQIELFIKKYYKNQMVKGIVLFVSIFLFSFLLVSGLEFFGRFGNSLRLILFYLFLGVNGFVFVKYIATPLFKLNKISKRLSLNDASIMIGSIFPDISDKLLNTLQLNSQLDNGQNVALLNASIEQRSSSLSIVPFTNGINFKENRKYLKFLLPIIFVLAMVGVLKPNILSDGSERIVNYNTAYVEPAPFEFNLVSSTNIVQGQNYRLELKLTGDEIPAEVKIESNLGIYNLQKESNILFVYEFSNVSENISFVCEANGFKSEMFEVTVLQNPAIEKMTLNVLYPKHTRLKNESLDNIGDVTVPEGTIIDWKLFGQNMSGLTANFKDTSFKLEPNMAGEFQFNTQVFSSMEYSLVLSSKDLLNGDTLFHNITAVPDAYPEIAVIDTQDSINNFRHFIEGTVSDDYGFKSLVANIKITRESNKVEKIVKSIKVNPILTKQFFYYQMDYSLFELKPGDKLEYTFIVTDNDFINGYKTSTSVRKIFTVPTLDSLDNLLSENNESLKNDIDKAKSEADKIKEKVKKIKNDLINKQTPDWKDKQNIQNLLNQQEDLQKQLDQLNNDFEQNKNDEEQFLDNSEELKDKQEELQKLLDELMDDEMKALMEELQKLMDDMNKDDVIDNLEKMEQKTETMEEELDRTLELFKNMELDKKLESIEDQLEKLSEEQKELQEETEDKKLSDEELAKKQEEINKKFDEIQKDIQEAKEKNEELEDSRDLDFDKEMEDQIEKETQEAKENLDNGKSKKSEKNQESASEMMKKMAEDVAAMQSASTQQKAEEDMDALRFLLENIVNLSHQEESVMLEYKVTNTTDPYYLDLNRIQLKVKQSTEIVKDSLIALSKRVFQLSSFINDELSNLNYNLNKSLIYSEERKTNNLMQHQQYAVTSYNNLALMLSEVLDQMQKEQKAKMQGKGSCSKPGGQGSGSGSSPQQSMQQIKDQMKKQIEKMKGGQQPGGKDGKKPGEGGEGGSKPGGKGGKIPGLSNEEVAKMAFQQGQMRKSLQEMRQELNKDGSGNGNVLNDLIKDMEQLEDDLLNDQYDKNLFKRQEDIMTRLLESEKAMQERGFSEKRESNSAKNNQEGNQIDLIQYNKKKNAEIELLRSIPVGLRVYYKNLVNEYFNSVNN